MLLTDMSNGEIPEVKPESAPSSPTKQDRSQLVELKNGRVLFRQKPLSCEKMSETMQEIVKFRDFMEERARHNCPPLQSIPEDHLPLIAKLVHESDKTIMSLAKQIQGALKPEDLESSEVEGAEVAALNLAVVESAIVAIADRINYGIDWTERVSAPLSIWRWEVKEQKFDFLPRIGRDRFEARLTERKQAKDDLRALFDAIPQSEKDSLTKSGKKVKGDIGNMSSAVNDENNQSGLNPEDDQTERKSPNVSEENTVGRQKKEKTSDPERLAKEKEKAEKKAAREEKERREKEAQSKSRSIMSSFFTKPKGTKNKLLKTGQPTSGSPQKNDPSSSKSDFEKTFKPFVVKKDATIAPINWFEHQKMGKDVIEIDQETTVSKAGTSEARSNSAALNCDPQELFREYIASVSLRLRRRSKAYSSTNCKSTSAHCVRDIFSRLSEAEVLGDTATVRALQSLLKSRTKIPAKILIFHEDTRPGYFGTYTKSSTVVGPRTPFAKDAVLFDYSYDSGEDWEEEEEGGDDLMSLGGSDDGNSSELGSELEDWLIDDDNDDLVPGTPLSEREGSPDFPLPGPEPSAKRKSTVDKEKKESKKRKVMPLVAFTKGPHWEGKIGKCEYDPFNQYRIQLFNDTPFPIDPFTFISTPVVPEGSALPKPVFVVPALPAHVQTSSSGLNANAFAVANHPAASVPISGCLPPPPKTPFPDVLLPSLADKIAALTSANLPWLVESLYQDFKAHKVKKNAIEAKVREVGEKCPIKKVWVVKEDVLRSLGRVPTASSA
ncbi:hypothetical protein DFH11DRAFT_1575389 [Phellopilus nigrolimitatus]|nr:hypothetical protein DFH11DRAFT_1575389 [Phellopilus nigrolimitatus]